MFELIEKNGHKGIFIGEVDDKPVVVSLKDAREYIDWYGAMEYAKNNGLRLPSQRELMLIYIHKDKINKNMKKVDGKPLENAWHWSSSEFTTNGALVVTVADGNVTYSSKYDIWHVRCVLDF